MFSRNKTVELIGRAFVFWLLTGWCGNSLRADTFGGFTYTTNSTSATITKYTGAGGDVVIPDTLGDKPVTKIDAGVFYRFDGLTSAFLPANVTNIGNFVFADCAGLASIGVDANNPSFSSDTGVLFNKTRTTLVQCPAGRTGTYTVPEGVTTLGYSAFLGCCDLINIDLSASISSIGNYAFSPSCDNLTSINVHGNNPNYSSDNGVLFNKTKTALVQYPRGRTGIYEIPLGVTNIGECAFTDCSKLTEVTIPAGVTIIGKGAFDACSGLTKVIMPSSVNNIGMYAFRNCYGITSVTIPASVKTVANRLFSGCNNLVRADFLGDAPSGMDSTVFGSCAASFKVYYLAGKTGFTSPTWNGYPSAVLGGTAILPPEIPSGTEYESWVLTNAAAWNAVNFTAVPAEDFERAWLLHTMPKTNVAATTDFQVKTFTVGTDQIQVTLGLGVAAQPKAGAVNGWLAIDGRESMTNAWQTMAGQSAGQNKLSFTNGQATVLFDKPAGMRFFRPRLQKDVPNGGAILPLNQMN